MATKPRITAPTKAHVARHFAVSKEAVGQWSQRWPFGHSGPFDLEAIARWRADNVAPRPTPMAEQDPSELSHLSRAMLLLRTRQAQRLQLEIEKLRRQLIPVDRAQAEVASALRRFRAAMLAGEQVITDRLELAGLITKRDEVERIISEWSNAILIELSTQLEDASDPPTK